jgi:hypothetical protein
MFAALQIVASSGCDSDDLARMDPPRLHEEARPATRGAWFETSDGRRMLMPFEEVDGYAVADGDIILGKIADVEAHVDAEGLVDKGAAIIKAGSKWPGGVVNYNSTSIQLHMPAKAADISAAMKIWSDATGVVFNDCPGARVPVDPDTGQVCTDYVAFGPAAAGACFSELGRRGGQQMLLLSSSCSRATIVHELGHTLGLFHEQSRVDRGDYVQIFPENIVIGRVAPDFDTWAQQGAQGIDIGPQVTCNIPRYNFDSVMQYGSRVWSTGAWPAMLRIAQSTMSGPDPSLYRWSSIGVWNALRSSPISNTNLGYGLFTSDAQTDLFNSNGSHWLTSSAGTGAWTQINSSSFRYRKARTATKLLLGDFDGNGRTDTLREGSGRWYVSWNATGGWATINSDASLNGSILRAEHLATGDFNGDEVTDVLAESGGNWYVRYGAAGAWELYADNTEAMPPVWEVGYGDFDGDDITDVFRVSGTNWQLYVPDWLFPVGTWANYKTGQNRGPLTQNATPGVFGDSIALGDFDGDGLTDVLQTWPSGIYYGSTTIGASGMPTTNINISMGPNLTSLHWDNFNFNFVHTCKTLSAGPRAGQRRCHSGADLNGDGVTEIVSSQIAPAEPPNGSPTLSRGDVWAFCSIYTELGGKCANGGQWTAATCPANVP